MNYVYKVGNTVNGKSYIGITSRSTETRWKEHLSRSVNCHRNSRLYAAIRKYGVEQFEVTTLDQTNCEDHVRELEKQYISKYDTYMNGYNCNLGGHGFLTFPDEIRKKISEGQKGKVIPLESRKKMSEVKLGDSRCAEHFGEHTNKGQDNPRAKYFLVKNPDGKVIVGRGIRAFCRDHNIAHCKLSSRGRTKGFELLGTFNDYPEREYTQASGSAFRP